MVVKMADLHSKMEVLVAMSGGVDSSVAAALLCRQGHRVTGVTMTVWDGPMSESDGRQGCYGPGVSTDIEDARRVAVQLGIPFRVFDLSSEYREEILNYLRAEYRDGRTPNPCSRCNPRIKFGALVQKAAASGIQFDYFATGHYARIDFDSTRNRFLLKKALDPARDQSYFLAFLSPKQISRTLLPVGEYAKSQVRAIASELGLCVSSKKDSQDFVAGGYTSLLDHQIPGPILNDQGLEIGRHRGIGYYTIGQRKGLGIASGQPLYVKEIDPLRNAVIVGERDGVYEDNLIASHLNWVGIDRIDGPLNLSAKIRYRYEEAEALLTPLSADAVSVQFRKPQLAVTPGQTVVFYDRDVVVGAGVIEKH
jgi:tRNA-uridine 2-sulfurtransferase